MSQIQASSRQVPTSTRKVVVAVTILIAAALIGFWINSRSSNEPLHKGKPISYWLDRDEQYGGTVEEIGAPAVPYLITRLRTRDTWWRTKWIKVRPLLPLAIRSHLPETEQASKIRSRAARGLAYLPSAALPAVPDLARLINDQQQVAWPAVEALANIGPRATAALPDLRHRWRSRDPVVRVETARALWTIGRETNVALEILTNSLSPTGVESLNAANVLAEMGKAAEATVPTLLHLLRDGGTRVTLRSNAAGALGRIGIISEDVITALFSGLKDPDFEVHGNCAVALWQLDTKYAPMVASLVVKYAVDLRWDSFVKFANRHHLDLKTAAPTLRELLRSEQAEVRKSAAEALHEIGESPRHE